MRTDSTAIAHDTHHLTELDRRVADLVPNANGDLHAMRMRFLLTGRAGGLTHILQHLHLRAQPLQRVVVLPLEVVGVAVPAGPAVGVVCERGGAPGLWWREGVGDAERSAVAEGVL